MALNSINTNIAALAAQSNIRTASNNASSSIARLSSGNRIVQASDDVASMSVGTSLRTQVNTLKTVLLNTAQGSSLLEVANGALEQITDILVRQKELTVQAGSGAISNTERAFLNQEFQHLTSEIDRLVESTNFNGVNLLDGSLSKSVAAVTNKEDVTLAGAATQVGTSAATIVFAVNTIVATDYVVLNGLRIDFTTAAAGTAAAAGKVVVGATVTESAGNFAAFVNQSTDARLANINFINNAGTLVGVYKGGQVTTAQDFSFVDGVANAASLTQAVANTVRIAAAATSEDGLTAASYGVSGTMPTVATAGAAGSFYIANGGVQLNAIATDTTVAANRGVMNNEAFIGNILQSLDVQSTGVVDTLTFRLRAGEILYTAVNATVVNAADTAIVLTGTNVNTGVVDGGNMRLIVRGGALATATFTAQQSEEIQSEMLQQMSGLTVRQNRNIRSFNDADAIATVGGVQVANITNMRANFISDDFSQVNIEDVKVSAPAAGSTDAKLQVKVNGEWYESYTGIGSVFNINQDIALFNTTTPSKAITFRTGTVSIAGSTTTALDLSTQVNADAIEAVLIKAFGVEDGNSAVQFQMGVKATDTIGVEMTSVDSNTLYSGKTLDILTAANAIIAGTQLDTSINLVKKVHADVGGYQSRFNYATANTESSIANQDAARGVFLDTDVAAESTAFATAQVQLQAGISVLAQANLMPQNLLKLIG